jgi:hypothetical protein
MRSKQLQRLECHQRGRGEGTPLLLRLRLRQWLNVQTLMLPPQCEPPSSCPWIYPCERLVDRNCQEGKRNRQCCSGRGCLGIATCRAGSNGYARSGR